MSIAAFTPLPTILLAALAAFAVTGCSVSLDLDDDTTRRVEQELVPIDGVTELEVDTENGAVEIAAGTADDVVIRAILRESDEGDADYTIETVGDRLVVRGECDSGLFDRCQVGFEITAPADLDLDVRTSNGRIVLAGIVGDVTVETDNGAIDGTALGAAVVDARTDNGAIDLRFDAAPMDVGAFTDNGAIDLRVPDAVYDVDADSGNGRVDVDVRVDPDAERRIVAESDNGAIDVGEPRT